MQGVKKNKLLYYINGYINLLEANIFSKKPDTNIINTANIPSLIKRINYYNKLNTITPLGNTAQTIKNYNSRLMPYKPSAYYFDMLETVKHFKNKLRVDFEFGDVITVPPSPKFVKSRPVNAHSQNSILLNLNKYRHFNFIKDDKPFRQKQNILLGRLSIYQQHRVDFYKKYFNSKMCDLGQVNNDTTIGDSKWLKPKISINDHLDYKFILSLEGNDVATNLNWIMSTNSIAVMPKPKYETWFMQGALIPDYHYISIADDYSNLEEKLQYYIDNPAEAENIVSNANKHVKQFMNLRTEKLVSYLVMEKFFYYTGQIDYKSINY